MSIMTAIANAYESAAVAQMRAMLEATGRQATLDHLAAPREFKRFSASGLGVFEAAQQRAMAKMDADGDGGLTVDELKAGLPGGQSMGAVDPDFFAAVDRNSDGRLQLGELQASSIFSMNTLNALLGEQAEAGGIGVRNASNIGAWMVSEADQDGDGALTAEEFAAVAPSGDYAPAPGGTQFLGSDILSKAGRAFFDADTDKDGKLTSQELAGLMQTGPHRVVMNDTTKLAPTLMKVADADSDGLLSAEEARAAAKTPQGLDAMFEQGDADKDGKLSAAEIKVMIDAKPLLHSTGMLQMNENLVDSAGQLALRSLLYASLSRLGESFKAQLDAPRVQATA